MCLSLDSNPTFLKQEMGRKELEEIISVVFEVLTVSLYSCSTLSPPHLSNVDELIVHGIFTTLQIPSEWKSNTMEVIF